MLELYFNLIRRQDFKVLISAMFRLVLSYIDMHHDLLIN